MNRWIIKPRTNLPFFDFWLNDGLLIPCALPPLLFLYRRFHLRQHDEPPTTKEILSHLFFWSILFEVIGPFWMRTTTGDVGDVIAYGIGAMVAWVWWQRGIFLITSQGRP